MKILVLAVIVAILFGCASTAPINAPIQAENKGRYYLDDGPAKYGEQVNMATEDAVPKYEPMVQATTKPYTVLGKTYKPHLVRMSYKVEGVASWYGKKYHGRRTAIGEIYDMFSMSGAHPVLPLPSYAKVTNLENNLSVVVRLNDRGPFLNNRIIDLSFAAASKLDFVETGTARVVVEVIGPLDVIPDIGGEFINTNLTYVQLGAFSLRNNAVMFLESVIGDLADYDLDIQIYPDGDVFKIWVGPFLNKDLASASAKMLRNILDLKPLVVSTKQR